MTSFPPDYNPLNKDYSPPASADLNNIQSSGPYQESASTETSMTKTTGAGDVRENLENALNRIDKNIDRSLSSIEQANKNIQRLMEELNNPSSNAGGIGAKKRTPENIKYEIDVFKGEKNRIIFSLQQLKSERDRISEQIGFVDVAKKASESIRNEESEPMAPQVSSTNLTIEKEVSSQHKKSKIILPKFVKNIVSNFSVLKNKIQARLSFRSRIAESSESPSSKAVTSKSQMKEDVQSVSGKFDLDVMRKNLNNLRSQNFNSTQYDVLSKDVVAAVRQEKDPVKKEKIQTFLDDVIKQRQDHYGKSYSELKKNEPRLTKEIQEKYENISNNLQKLQKLTTQYDVNLNFEELYSAYNGILSADHETPEKDKIDNLMNFFNQIDSMKDTVINARNSMKTKDFQACLILLTTLTKENKKN